MTLLNLKLQLLPANFWFLMHVNHAKKGLTVLAGVTDSDYRKVIEVLLVMRPRRSMCGAQGFLGYCISDNNCK